MWITVAGTAPDYYRIPFSSRKVETVREPNNPVQK
jgi:hypothetical protein